MNFGAYLRALREEKKLSVNQLAMYSEVSAAADISYRKRETRHSETSYD